MLRSKITNEMFDAKLVDMVENDVVEKGISILLSIPGIYEILSERYNNDVLEALEYDYQEEDS